MDTEPEITAYSEEMPADDAEVQAVSACLLDRYTAVYEELAK